MSSDSACPSELCRCQEYEDIVDNFQFFLPGTLHFLDERLKAPPRVEFKFVKNRLSPHELNFTKPYLADKRDRKFDVAIDGLPTKWIPVLPGLISQRLVNENRSMNKLLL